MSMRQGPFQFGRVPMTFTFQSEVAERIIAPLVFTQNVLYLFKCIFQ